MKENLLAECAALDVKRLLSFMHGISWTIDLLPYPFPIGTPLLVTD